MTFEEMMASGRRMTREQVEEGVRRMAADPGLPALLGLVWQQRESYVADGSQQVMASAALKQSHAWGSVYALDELMNTMQGMMTPRKIKGGKGEG